MMYSGIFTQRVQTLWLDLVWIAVWLSNSSLYDLGHSASPDEVNKWYRVDAKQAQIEAAALFESDSEVDCSQWKQLDSLIMKTVIASGTGMHRKSQHLNFIFSLCSQRFNRMSVRSAFSFHWFVSTLNVCKNMATVSAKWCTEFHIADSNDC